MEISAIDLFCGIGGLTCGVIKSGIKVIAGVDIDSSCEYAYKINNNSQFILSSVSELDSNVIRNLYPENSIKVLMGCAPCQPFSKLQKDKKNINSEKWGLLYSFLSHVENILPEIVSMENVPELEKEEVFLDFVDGLKALGYFVDYKIANAANYGVPQRRKRLLLLASSISPIRLISDTHDKEKHVTVKTAIGHLPKIEAGQVDSKDDLHRSAFLSEINLTRIKNSKPGGNWKDWPIELLPKCYKKDSGSTFTSVYGRMKWDEISPTLTTQFNRYGTGRYGHPEQNRALSLREGAIIQSFPEDYKFINPSIVLKPDEIARQIGNAVPVRLGEIIGESIIQHLKNMN